MWGGGGEGERRWRESTSRFAGANSCGLRETTSRKATETDQQTDAIEPGGRYSLGCGRRELVIDLLTEDDDGQTYTCQVDNQLGRAQGSMVPNITYRSQPITDSALLTRGRGEDAGGGGGGGEVEGEYF